MPSGRWVGGDGAGGATAGTAADRDPSDQIPRLTLGFLRRGTIGSVITVLLYLVIAALIGVVIFFLAVLVFGRGEQMAPLEPRTAPAELPEAGIGSADVGALRFSMALRGYRMSDVDWALARLGRELDLVRAENGALRRGLADVDPGHPLLATGEGGGVDPAGGPAAREDEPAGREDELAAREDGPAVDAAEFETVGAPISDVPR